MKWQQNVNTTFFSHLFLMFPTGPFSNSLSRGQQKWRQQPKRTSLHYTVFNIFQGCKRHFQLIKIYSRVPKSRWYEIQRLVFYLLNVFHGCSTENVMLQRKWHGDMCTTLPGVSPHLQSMKFISRGDVWFGNVKCSVSKYPTFHICKTKISCKAFQICPGFCIR